MPAAPSCSLTTRKNCAISCLVYILVRKTKQNKTNPVWVKLYRYPLNTCLSLNQYTFQPLNKLISHFSAAPYEGKKIFCLLPLELHLQLICTRKVIPKETKHTEESTANRGKFRLPGKLKAVLKLCQSPLTVSTVAQPTTKEDMVKYTGNQPTRSPPEVGHVKLLEDPPVM